MKAMEFKTRVCPKIGRAALFLAAISLAWVATATSAWCEPPFQNLFKRSGAASNAPMDHELKPEHGPWLVFAMSFEGENAKTQAKDLADELQRSLNVPVFVMPKKFDYSDVLYGSGITESGKQKVMKYQGAKVVDGAAVLVGEFDSAESPMIQHMLETVKTYRPKAMNQQAGATKKNEEVSVKDWRSLLRNKYSDNPKDKTLGPMYGAFVTRNPMLPDDFFRAPDVEKFVYDLNHDPGYKEFNLLDCKGKYTVRVATFLGENQYQGWGRQTAAKKEANANELTELEKAAQTAYLVTKALRAGGIEAYQFHDRTQSIVTVGSFDELGAVDAQNQFQYSRVIQETVKKFGATQKVRQLKTGTAAQPTLLFDVVDQRKIPELYQGTRPEQLELFRKLSIGFDLRPLPMTVPRYHASRVYAGSLLGGKR